MFAHDIDILLANFAEAQTLLNVTDMADITAAMQKAGVDGAITCGGDGAVIVHGGEAVRVDAYAVETVTDLTGAGDQFAAGYLCGVARGRDAQHAGAWVRWPLPRSSSISARARKKTCARFLPNMDETLTAGKSLKFSSNTRSIAVGGFCKTRSARPGRLMFS